MQAQPSNDPGAGWIIAPIGAALLIILVATFVTEAWAGASVAAPAARSVDAASVADRPR
ncbi:MAG: hypothetical protein H6983_04390 [Ectothiorhodospiraceae bacterium]|nr:hypothetical protein [Ectothiorhodospiraceae bacterium]